MLRRFPQNFSADLDQVSQQQSPVETARAQYKELLAAGIDYEDARYLLPSSIETHISVAMNAGALNNLFSLRLCRRAQWEICELAAKMRKIVRSMAPSLFWNECRPCVRRGFCPESGKSCGFWKRDEYHRERERFKRGYPYE
ncbi:MAG: FAD-dependent thymidylate synthase [Candidatus Bathyarchaeum sp.]|nr:MAG: FAD-dependent thymidylate synthase [Candidatus Bathyarchaeum sp.]